METWEFYFMMGTGLYLSLFGWLMSRSNKKYMGRGVGIYNIIMGILSIAAGILGKSVPSMGSKIFSNFVVVLIASFLLFSILNVFTKKR